MSIRIKPTRKIQDFRIRAYAPDNTYLGLIRDELQLLDFQVQVKEGSSEGYYIKFKGERFEVDKCGKIFDFGKIDEEPITIHKMLKTIVGF